MPMVELRVITAEGGQVLDLLLSWKTMCSFIFHGPRAVCLSGVLLGRAGTWMCHGRLQVPLALGKLVGQMGIKFALVIGKETVFSGRWHWTEG